MCDPSIRISSTPRRGMQMRALMVGMAVVVAIGLMWSVAAMSNLVPVVDGSVSAATSPAAE
jgi:flagellar biosynthesis protein FliR